MRPLTLEVSGERFVVTQRPDTPWVYDFAWVSGPDPAYGFTSSGPRDRPRPSDAALAEEAEAFLQQVDRATGHLRDTATDEG
ncbi:hypothetical protein [Nocardioides lijunqiniae]|uniref:hypothetical protein n=1 Tax=Nocardioides lijunqiniae TaxID=2760832 RepID=UPI0018782E7B|nr:hypothetical protein [Nocardioides lijunqiniae]